LSWRTAGKHATVAATPEMPNKVMPVVLADMLNQCIQRFWGFPEGRQKNGSF
jgi:hypothetical protein